MATGDFGGSFGIWPGSWDEHRFAVVAQFLDALLDVCQSPMIPPLGRRGEICLGEPTPTQFLDRGDINDPVVKELVQLGHVASQEGSVRGNTVSCKWRATSLGAVLLDVGQDLILCLSKSEAVVQYIQKPTVDMHLAYERDHLVKSLLRRFDQQVHAIAKDIQLRVGHQGRHFDKSIGSQIEPGHLTIDPHQSVSHRTDLTQTDFRSDTYYCSMPNWKSFVGILARLIVGGFWLVAGALKIGSPESSVTAVRAYQLLPMGTAEAVGRVLPTLELVLGVCLILGVLVRASGLLSSLMQLAFIIGIASVWIRGIPIDCGCFGDGGAIASDEEFSKYPGEIARDGGLMLLSLWLGFGPATPLAVGRYLLQKTEEINGE